MILMFQTVKESRLGPLTRESIDSEYKFFILFKTPSTSQSSDIRSWMLCVQ